MNAREKRAKEARNKKNENADYLGLSMKATTIIGPGLLDVYEAV